MCSHPVPARYAARMGHNVTRQKRRGEFMKLALPELAAWHLIIRCSGCPDDRYLPIATLIERYGTQHTLGRIVPRLRCQFRICRQAPASVKIFSSLDEDAVCVTLVGPGAF
jgi:hypothetical protein